ncbi:MAG: MarR family transcriptional regulator [Rhodospirillaceae bacterium]
MSAAPPVDKNSADYKAGLKAGHRTGILKALSFDLSRLERYVLMHWWEKRKIGNQTKLAEELGIHRTALTNALTGLVKAGFIVRTDTKIGECTEYADGPYFTEKGNPFPVWKPTRKPRPAADVTEG